MSKNILVKRFWFEFEFETAFDLPPGIAIGCGISAYNQDDAIGILEEKVFPQAKRPAIKKIIENVDIRTLDQGHVIPNMGAPIYRGIWFPLGYD